VCIFTRHKSYSKLLWPFQYREETAAKMTPLHSIASMAMLLLALTSHEAFGFRAAFPSKMTARTTALSKLNLISPLARSNPFAKQSRLFSESNDAPSHIPSQIVTDLEKFGDDIEILPPSDGVVKIVMKFGGSSLASAERITYVSK